MVGPLFDPAPAVRRQGVHARGGLRDRDQDGDLAPTEILDRLVEVEPRRMGQPMAAMPERRQNEILAQHGRAAMPGDHQDRHRCLPRLHQQGTGRRILHPRDLHGDCGGAGAAAPGLKIAKQGATDRDRVHAWVRGEAPILQRQQGSDRPFRDVFARPEAVNAVALRFPGELRQEPAFAIGQIEAGGRLGQIAQPPKDRRAVDRQG